MSATHLFRTQRLRFLQGKLSQPGTLEWEYQIISQLVLLTSPRGYSSTHRAAPSTHLVSTHLVGPYPPLC